VEPTDTPWLTDDEQRTWRAFLRLHGRLDVALGRHLQAGSELSQADFGVLVQLTETRDGRSRAYELGRFLEWEKSRLSHHLTRMEKRGLVVRQDCPTDRRGAFVAVTPAGRRAIESAAPAHVREVRRLVFDVLTPAQVASLREISETLLQNLDGEGCAAEPGCGDPAPFLPHS